MKKRHFEKALAAALSAGMVMTMLPQGVVAAEPADSVESAMEAEFADVEMQYKPYARWWLAEGSHTDTTLKESIQELYDYGFGGVEFVTLNESSYLDNETYAWGSDEWIHDSQLIIKECQKLGMSVSMTSGTNWSTANLVTINPDMQEAAQELGYKAVSLTGDGEKAASYSGALPVCELPALTTKQTLVAVIAAKVAERGDKVKLDMDSLKDITDLVADEDGDGVYTIDYTAEDAGDYEIIAFYQYGTGETQSPAKSTAYTINYLDKAGANALIEYWDENILTDELQEIIDQIDECDMYMDSLETQAHGTDSTGMLWSQYMLDEFSSRRNYDLTKYLPFMCMTSKRQGGFGSAYDYAYEPADTEDEDYVDNLRNDVFQTFTELYTENCLEVLSDWLHSKHMKLRAENSYGCQFEISQPIKALDYVETESMEFGNEIDSHRNQAGAAHLFGKRYSSESGAWVMSNYVYNNEYYRQMFYMQYASGIQKSVFHGYSAAWGPEGRVSWPGYEGMSDVWSDRFNKRQPASTDYDDMNAELARIQKVLEKGVPQMDIGMLRTDYGFNNQLCPGGLFSFIANGVYSNRTHTQDAYYWRDLELQNNGYTYDYFSPYLLNDEEVSCTDGLVNADGVAYQALIVMEDELPYDSAVKLLQWTKDGLPVVFVNNVVENVEDNSNNEAVIEKVNTQAGSTTGSNDGMDEALAEVVAQIKEQSSVRTVDSTADAMEALQELGVYPRAQYVEENTKLLSVMRKTDDANYLYVYHYMYEDEENYAGDISVDGLFTPYVLDTFSGDVSKVVDYEQKDGRTILHVDMAPGEVVVFILDKTEKNTVTVASASDNVYKMLYEDGQIKAAVKEGTKATVKFSDGSSDTVKAAAPEDIELTGWNLVVDSYEPGDKLTRTETNEDTGVTTTEVTYATNHVAIDAGTLEELVPWKDIEAIGDKVSGIGTYTTTFTLPENWNSEDYGVEFKAGSFCGGTATVVINGHTVPVNYESYKADLSAYAVPGENTLEVNVTSSLYNAMINYGYDGWTLRNFAGGIHPDSYGMTGDTTLTTYVKVAVTSRTEKINMLKQAIRFLLRKVTLKSVKSSKRGTLTVKVKTVKDAAGYIIKYARNAKFTNSKNKVTKNTTATLTNLKSCRIYYVKAKAYTVIGGKKITTAYSTPQKTITR